MWNYNYYIYIVTNPRKQVLYTGVTNDLKARVIQHYNNRGNKSSFAGRYYCHHLIYYEHFTHIEHAIEREKEIENWRREKKEKLIKGFNPNWNFLESEFIYS
ncbi:MAG: GIY-YIG nuclease family protein [Bacteroidia bacterium]|nr:GIY-YIG nuclease family protein [Bacteroidia bacterium]